LARRHCASAQSPAPALHLLTPHAPPSSPPTHHSFRGVIQQGLANNIGGIPALALASLVFGLAHKLGPSDFGFITAAGAYMGLSYLICGNLTVPIALHAFYDLLLLVQAYTRGKKLLDRTQGRR
jgi:hypothetical protein